MIFKRLVYGTSSWVLLIADTGSCWEGKWDSVRFWLTVLKPNKLVYDRNSRDMKIETVDPDLLLFVKIFVFEQG